MTNPFDFFAVDFWPINKNQVNLDVFSLKLQFVDAHNPMISLLLI